jgi:hypothetical protein
MRLDQSGPKIGQLTDGLRPDRRSGAQTVLAPSGLRAYQASKPAPLGTRTIANQARDLKPTPEPRPDPTSAPVSSDRVAAPITATEPIATSAATVASKQRSSAYWRGASGRLYRHVVHGLTGCPAPLRGVYVIVGRDAEAGPVALFIGAAASSAPSLNLAHIRRRAAQLQAPEVHLLELPQLLSGLALRRIVRDLRRASAT